MSCVLPICLHELTKGFASFKCKIYVTNAKVFLEKVVIVFVVFCVKGIKMADSIRFSKNEINFSKVINASGSDKKASSKETIALTGNTNNGVSSGTAEAADAMLGTPKAELVLTRDSQGRVIQEKTLDDKGNGLVVFYAHNDKGKQIKTEERNLKNNIVVETNKYDPVTGINVTNIKYDPDTKTQVALMREPGGSGWKRKWVENFDDAGTKIREERYTASNGDSSWTSKTVRTFDKNGNFLTYEEDKDFKNKKPAETIIAKPDPKPVVNTPSKPAIKEENLFVNKPAAENIVENKPEEIKPQNKFQIRDKFIYTPANEIAQNVIETKPEAIKPENKPVVVEPKNKPVVIENKPVVVEPENKPVVADNKKIENAPVAESYEITVTVDGYGNKKCTRNGELVFEYNVNNQKTTSPLVDNFFKAKGQENKQKAAEVILDTLDIHTFANLSEAFREANRGRTAFFDFLCSKQSPFSKAEALERIETCANKVIIQAKNDNRQVDYNENWVNKSLDAAKNTNNKKDIKIASLRIEAALNSASRKVSLTNNSNVNDTPNSKIDKRTEQGHIGNCWWGGATISTANNEEGSKIIENSLKYDGDTVTVKLPGMKAPYTFSVSWLKGETHLSKGDIDLRALEAAVERHALEYGLKDPTSGEMQYTIDGSYTSLAFELLTGRKTKDVTPSKSNLRRLSKDKTAVMTAQVNTDTKTKYVASKVSDRSQTPVVSGHAYSVQKITDKEVFIINPWDSSEILSMPIDEFSKTFTYITVGKV